MLQCFETGIYKTMYEPIRYLCWDRLAFS